MSDPVRTTRKCSASIAEEEYFANTTRKLGWACDFCRKCRRSTSMTPARGVITIGGSCLISLEEVLRTGKATYSPWLVITALLFVIMREGSAIAKAQQENETG